MSIVKLRLTVRKAVVAGAIAAVALAGLAVPAADATEPAAANASEATAPAAAWSAPVAAAVVATQEGPAFGARATCSGLTCEGKNPDTTGCSTGAITVRSSNTYAYYELRYSATCRAFWARVQLSPGWTWYKEISVERWYGGSRQYLNVQQANRGSTGYKFTMMAGGVGGRDYRACFRDPGTGQVSCTSMYRLPS